MPTPKEQLGKIIRELKMEEMQEQPDWDRVQTKGIDLELAAMAGKGEFDALKDSDA